MSSCLLCPSPVVLDGLCVPCGSTLWAAETWTRRPAVAARLVREVAHPEEGDAVDPERERIEALREISTPQAAHAFLTRLDAARKARAAAPLCSRGCTSHDEREGPR